MPNPRLEVIVIYRLILLLALLLLSSPAYAIPAGPVCIGGQCQFAKPAKPVAALPPAAYKIKYKGVCQGGTCAQPAAARPRILKRIFRR